MKVLVTGSSGQLARSLVERVGGQPGIELIAIGRHELDLEIPGSSAAVIRRAQPDVVINVAALTDVDGAEEQQLRAHRINAEAAGEVAAAATAVDAPIIQISTDYVFDGKASSPYCESAQTNPLNAYGRTKLAGEHAVRAANPDHLILRTAWVYSPFGRNFVKTMFEAAQERQELRVVADQRGSPTSAVDLARALLAIVDRWRAGATVGQGEIFHLAGSGEASWYDLACAVMSERISLGLSAANILPIATSEWPTRARRPRYSVLDSNKFEHAFGLAMPDWRQSLGEVIKRLAEAQ